MISSLPVGDNVLTAEYLGNENFQSSSSFSIFYQVNRALSSTSLKVNPTSSTFGEAVTLEATVSSDDSIPSGSVIFKDGTTELGTSNLGSQGRAYLSIDSLSVGTHSLTAVFTGHEYTTSTSSPVNLQVSKASTTTSIASDINPSAVGEEITLTAIVSSLDGVSMEALLLWMEQPFLELPIWILKVELHSRLLRFLQESTR